MSLLLPILIVIAAWWIGTGAVLYLQQSIAAPKLTLKLALSFVSLVSLAALLIGSSGTAVWQSYLGFVAALSLWGCLELSYYTGLVAGVHTRSCPANCTTARRFRLALGASIWHEISVLTTGALVVALLTGAQNPTGLYAFLVLWLMRWSAKLNLFLGIPNFNTDWFPKRLAYAHSYIRRAPVTIFFPGSVVLATLVAVQMFAHALESTRALELTLVLPGTLLLLAILEHLFMALPIADSELWNRIFARDDNDSVKINDTETTAAQSISRS